VKNGPCLLILVEGSAHAGLQTIGLFTMTALEAEGNFSFLLHEDAGQGSWIFFLEGLKDIFGLRVLHDAVDFAEATSHADLFFNKDSFHD
jgi:hypothetical protein